MALGAARVRASSAIDAAPRAIARGQALVAALGLDNVTLEARRDRGPRAGARAASTTSIAHGVYSWVPAAVRDRLLAVCRAALAERGVAYVSYNALPGGRLREALRDMLVFHTAELDRPARARRAGAGAAALPARGRAGASTRSGRSMRGQAERLLARSDATLLHDELAEVNDAVYFHEFAAHAARHGLQYLAEADFFEMQIGAASEPAAQALLADRGPGAPRAVPRLPQGADVPPDAAVPRRAGDRPHAAPRGARAPRRLHARRSPAASAAPTARRPSRARPARR